MNDEIHQVGDADADIRRLLAVAGPRLQPPAEVEARVRAATLAAVAALPDRPDVTQPERSWGRYLAVAAMLVVALATGYLMIPIQPLEPAGEIVFASGGYTVRGSDGVEGGAVLPGSILQTSGESRMLVGLRSGPTLRLDRSTRLTLHSAEEVWLHGGRIYIETEDGSGGSITIVTPFASVTDIGTRFEVVVEGETLEVAIREGLVDVRTDAETIRTAATGSSGELLTMRSMAVETRESLPTSSERWDWIQDARPSFQLSGRSILEYLEWVARESGRPLLFADATVRQQASLRRFGGRYAQADLDDLTQTLATTRFRVSEGTHGELLVGLATR